MSKVLGRVLREADRPRGPDVQFEVRVPASWLAEGAKIAVELPRNLSCAVCRGGGCDACQRAGAVSLRGRQDPVERVEVRLPAWSTANAAGETGIVLRIPERGGPPLAGSDLPRGNLLLSIQRAPEPDACVLRQPTDREGTSVEALMLSRVAFSMLAALAAAMVLWWLIR